MNDGRQGGDFLDKMNKAQWRSLGLTLFSVVAGAILLYFFLGRFDIVWDVLSKISRILRPVQYGLVLTFLLLPIHRYLIRWQMAIVPTVYLEKEWVKRLLNYIAVALSLVFAGVVVYALLAMLLPQLYLSIVGLIYEIPTYIDEIQSWLVKIWEDNPTLQTVILQNYETVTSSLENWLATDVVPDLTSVSGIIQWGKDNLLSNLTGVVSNVYSLLIALILLGNNLFVGVVVTIYLLARKDVFGAQAKKITYSIFSTSVADQIVIEVRDAYRILSGFINGKLLDSLIVGIITLICANWLDLPYPVLLATVIGVTNIIPFFGPFIGGIPCGILVLLVDPMKLVYFVIFIFVLQQVDGQILGPKILGDSTGLASFWVIFSILLFGGLFGFTGMLLGVPVFAMLYNIANKLVRRGLRKRGLSTETEDYMGQTEPLEK